MTLTFFNNLTPGSCYTLKLRVFGICLLTEVLQTCKVRWTDRLTDTVGRWTWWFHYASFKTYTLASVIKNLQKWSIPWIYPKPQYFMVQNKFLKKSLRTQPKWYFKDNRGSSRDALHLSFFVLPVFLLLHCLIQSFPSPVDGIQFLPHPFGIQHVGLSYDVISCCVHIA